jgi:hypothetical protein
MRIVGLKEFLELPRGTVFAEYSPVYLGDIRVKVGNIGDWDFQYDCLDNIEGGIGIPDLQEMAATGADVPVDLRLTGRAGLSAMDHVQQFAVWSRSDVRELITRLEESIEEVDRDTKNKQEVE